jgi:hypothetical protein
MVLLVQVHANPREAYELIQVLEAENAALRSAVAKAREALEPFAHEMPADWLKDDDAADPVFVLAGDLRRVRSALAALDEAEKGK